MLQGKNRSLTLGHRYFGSAFTIRSQEYHDEIHTQGMTASMPIRTANKGVEAYEEYQV